ncbi:MAG: acetylglutamate kinase [Armatimonadetes bacterium RBG_19FT_COMBO_69_19]|nr:MAG: acetylglutamate kinase [Armatimonadetes bacterium RBG_19FT_COMBO_69_19]
MALQTHDAIDLGGSLARALQYVNAWKGKTVVVKFGGSVMSADDQGTVVGDLVLLKGAGVHPVVVHGGGPEITRLLERLGKKSRFVNGLRVTDEDTMEVVEMVLAGRANKALVSLISKAGGSAVGISGKDGRVFQAHRLAPELGQVGEIDAVDTSLVTVLSQAGYIPVVASIGIGAESETYNLNADHAAGALAAAMGASKFILMTDVRGVYRGQNDAASLLSILRAREATELIREGVISRGMIPKVQACLDAIASGVPTAHIVSGILPHALLVELFTQEGVGTMIVPD